MVPVLVLVRPGSGVVRPDFVPDGTGDLVSDDVGGGGRPAPMSTELRRPNGVGVFRIAVFSVPGLGVGTPPGSPPGVATELRRPAGLGVVRPTDFSLPGFGVGMPGGSPSAGATCAPVLRRADGAGVIRFFAGVASGLGVGMLAGRPFFGATFDDVRIFVVRFLGGGGGSGLGSAFWSSN